jgi:hypothetical protein
MTAVTIPVEWITLVNTHDESERCQARGCVIHSPSLHHMRYWPLHWRGDRGIFERICPHGVGHPDPDQFGYWRELNQMWQAIHGCCCFGCCNDWEADDDNT